MSISFPQKITTDSVFVWLMHRIAEEFDRHAILKGGMALRLVNCPRNTNDLDYVFVPFNSKKEIEKGLDKILGEIPNAEIRKSMNSEAIRVQINVAGVSAQIEASVAKECRAMAMSTSSIANKEGLLSRIIQIMSMDVALSHKLAAWNERRLYRDLYDVYYIFEILGIKPDLETLKIRLEKVESRLPKLKTRKKMQISEFAVELKQEVGKISSAKLTNELSGLFGETELAGLELKLKAVIQKIIEFLANKEKELV